MKKPTNKEIKDIDNEELNTLADQRDDFKDMEILAASKGGQLLVSSLLKDVVSSVETLCMDYNKLTQPEFIALSAGMKEKIDIVRVLTRAEKNRKFIDSEIQEQFESILTN